MSSERGNVSRTRPQRHQNARAFENDKYDTSARRKKINAKLHDGVCQHCKGILEWRVKFRKYKLLTKPKKCVKCLQKTVKDPYHIICRPCAGKLEICAKCGKQEEIVIPIDKGQDRTDSETSKTGQERSKLKDKLDFDTNFSSADSDEDSDVLEEQFKKFRDSSGSHVVFSDMKRFAQQNDAYRVMPFPVSIPVLVKLYKELKLQ
ncbi:uncharacterized protein C9orf85 homolog isoform X3 [Passer montanus]|uniref:uncharacterized protein C9orf85 homolog isoform X3 n=1 Tax=Passer montanus TaxID=9160 RepID=UPI0019606892|nr:uncharacterized protein C9orf85 homolog isoform X3 [Passer montanus]